MAMDMQAAVKITASVNGGAAIDQLRSSMDRLDSANSKLVSGFKALGAAGAFLAFKEAVQGITNFTTSIIASMSALDDLSEKTGSTVEKLSAIANVAKISGVELDSVGDAMIKLTKNLKGVDADSRGAAEALKFLGINFNEFKRLDPSDQLVRVAKEMDKFRDGTGKTSLAIDLLGKSGASTLPFLKDLAANSELNAKVTAQQAAMAEQLEQAFRRLKIQFFDSARALAIDLVPAINAFIGGLNEAVAKTNLFADNDAIKGFAEITAKSLAVLIDVFVAFIKAASALAGSFQSVFADIKLAGTFAFGGTGWNPFSDENKKILSDALAERNKIVENANAKYVDLWNFDGSAFFNAVSKRFGEQPEEAAPQQPKPAAGYTPRTDKQDGDAKKLLLQLELIGKYKAAQQGLLSAREDELASVDMTAIAYKNLVDVKTLDNKNAEMSVGLLPKAKEELDRVTESLKLQVVEFNNMEYAMKRTFDYSATKFLRDYVEEITDVGKQTERVMSNAFKGVEDALVEFTMTGKFNFKDFASSIIRDLVRIQIQQTTMKTLAGITSDVISWLRPAASVGVGDMTKAAGFYAKGGAFEDGVQAFASGGVVSKPTMFPMANGAGLMGEAGPEAIMPLKRTASGALGIIAQGGGGQVNNVTVNVSVSGEDTKSDTGTGAALGGMISRVVQSELLRQKRPGGLLAA